ncbi:MAG TPA: hypothetical protein DCR14_14855 [Acidimicrobiaceae bacterium]|nr:hypothetical protein [Acidimicrobiaceae bacterium]
MYGVPHDLDLSAVVGEFTTQVRVGQYDLQFTFGSVNFAVESQASVLRGNHVVAHWSAGVWPIFRRRATMLPGTGSRVSARWKRRIRTT